MSTRVKTVKDNTKLVQQAIRALKGKVVKVGILGDKAARDEGPLNNVALGAIHEFGAPEKNIPERSFLRSTANEHRDEYVKQLVPKNLFTRTQDFDKQLALLGEKAASDIKRKIKEGIPPPLQPATIKSKGSSKPLVDTGQLITSISYQVTKKGGDE